jgi:hypothetical protein
MYLSHQTEPPINACVQFIYIILGVDSCIAVTEKKRGGGGPVYG